LEKPKEVNLDFGGVALKKGKERCLYWCLEGRGENQRGPKKEKNYEDRERASSEKNINFPSGKKRGKKGG